MTDLEPIGFVSSQAHEEVLDDLERVIKNNVAPIHEEVGAVERDVDSQDAVDKNAPKEDEKAEVGTQEQLSEPTPSTSEEASEAPKVPETSKEIEASDNNVTMDVDE